MIVYHGTTSIFDHFDLAHLGEGEGKSKFMTAIYIVFSNYVVSLLKTTKAFHA